MVKVKSQKKKLRKQQENANLHNVKLTTDSLYCTNKPCVICSKMIINAGIKKIVYEEGYDDPLSDQMCAEAGLELLRFKT